MAEVNASKRRLAKFFLVFHCSMQIWIASARRVCCTKQSQIEVDVMSSVGDQTIRFLYLYSYCKEQMGRVRPRPLDFS